MKKRSDVWEKNHQKKYQYTTIVEHGIDKPSQHAQFDLLKEYVSMKQHNMTILEIGAGNGRLCQLVLKNYGEYIKKYVIVEDKNRILNIQKNYLSDFNNVEYVEIDDVEKINENFDLFISNNCLEETPHEYQNFIFEKFLVKSKPTEIAWSECRKVFIIQNIHGYHGDAIRKPSAELMKNEILMKIFSDMTPDEQDNINNVVELNTTEYCNRKKIKIGDTFIRNDFLLKELKGLCIQEGFIDEYLKDYYEVDCKKSYNDLSCHLHNHYNEVSIIDIEEQKKLILAK